jgi:tight adherence protein B
LARCLLLAERTGASAATALRSTAADLRSARRRRARVSAHRLGVSLVLPLGLTTLPAFLLWAVVPIVLGLAEQVLISAS